MGSYRAIHIRLTEEQYQDLRRKAFEQERSQAEIIRDALDRYMKGESGMRGYQQGFAKHDQAVQVLEGMGCEVHQPVTGNIIVDDREITKAEWDNMLTWGVYELAEEITGQRVEIKVVIIEAGEDYTDPVATSSIPRGSDELDEAVEEAEGLGFRVMEEDEGGCIELVEVSDGEDYIAVTVWPEE